MASKEHTFDLKIAQALAADYANATGVECLVLQEENQKLINPCSGKFHKQLCFEESPEIAKWCALTHHRGAVDARNQKCCVSYFCPMGLLHWTAPIVIGGQIRGALVAGHAFLNHERKDVLTLSSRSPKFEELLDQNPTLLRSLLSSPVIDDEKLASLKRLLLVIADSLSDDSLTAGHIPQLEDLLQINRQHTGNPAWQFFAEQLKAGNPIAIEKGLQSVIEELRGGRQTLSEFKTELANAILTIYQKQENDDSPNYLTDISFNALNEMERISDKEAMADWASRTIRALLEAAEYLPSIKNADIIYSALEYIDSHYQEHISLQGIADHTHFSPPYFSKIFKKEMNMTFTQYLTKVRIEASKKLLREKSIPLSDIPAMVGFEEQSYFTKVFHAVVGTSPGKYREQKNY